MFSISELQIPVKVSQRNDSQVPRTLTLDIKRNIIYGQNFTYLTENNVIPVVKCCCCNCIIIFVPTFLKVP